ncbi:Uncharacterised protein [Mycobacteroides abscessus subsp. abscessus]|nr:Uncharacterised protein [Mycobacteroides abscessus subsp. abscessus]
MDKTSWVSWQLPLTTSVFALKKPKRRLKRNVGVWIVCWLT